MTSQTKSYIELPDILAMQLVCKKCQASVTLPIYSESGVSMTGIRVCPNCNEPWIQNTEGSNIEPSVKKFVAALVEFNGIVKRWSEFYKDGGFSLSLEINPEVVLKEKK